MGKKARSSYTPDFREQAVDLGNRIGMSRAAKELGVDVANVRRWKREQNSEANVSCAKLTAEEEIRRLKKENDELKKVNQILKRAAAFFSQDHLK